MIFKIQLYLYPFKTKHSRQIYTALDWLGDVGGLLDGMKFFGGILIPIYSFFIGDPLSAFIINSTYKRDSRRINQVFIAQENQPRIDRIHNLRNFRTLPCIRCRSKKEQRILGRALQRTEKILEIDHFVRTMMQVRIALKTIFTKTERYLI